MQDGQFLPGDSLRVASDAYPCVSLATVNTEPLPGSTTNKLNYGWRPGMLWCSTYPYGPGGGSVYLGLWPDEVELLERGTPPVDEESDWNEIEQAYGYAAYAASGMVPS